MSFVHQQLWSVDFKSQGRQSGEFKTNTQNKKLRSKNSSSVCHSIAQFCFIFFLYILNRKCPDIIHFYTPFELDWKYESYLFLHHLHSYDSLLPQTGGAGFRLAAPSSDILRQNLSNSRSRLWFPLMTIISRHYQEEASNWVCTFDSRHNVCACVCCISWRSLVPMYRVMSNYFNW